MRLVHLGSPAAFALAALLLACSSSSGGNDSPGDGGGAVSGDATPADGSSGDASAPSDAANQPGADGGEGGATGEGGAGHDDGGGAQDAGSSDGAAAEGGGSDGATGGGDAAGGDAAAGATCGGARCYAGQSCVAGACSFTGCSGAQVPGDYATVQDAVNALASTGGTVCLGAQTYGEMVIAQPNKPLVIQGLSPAQTALTGLVLNGAGGTTVQGIALQELSVVAATGTISVQACTIDSSASGNYAVSVALTDDATALAVTLDGVDLVAGGSAAVNAYAVQNEATDLTMTIRNSYLHGSNAGIQLEESDGDGVGFATLVVDNDTFYDDQTALLFNPATTGWSAAYYNDVFYQNSLAVNLGPYVTTTFGNNALFGNGTNYAGGATDGAGDVKADPLLDMSVTPPAPGAGSPLLGAADPAHAPSADFWGAARGSHPDIGAVQVSP